MTDVVIVYDADGRYLEIGPTNPINLARPPAEMLGRTVSDFFTPAEAGLLLHNIRHVLEIGQPIELDYSLLLGNEVRWFSALVSPFSADSVLWVAHDITERKRAEEALQDSETRFRSLLENGRDNISLVTAEGTLIWESPAVKRTLGYRQGEFIGGSMFDLLHPDDANRVQALLGMLLQEPGGRQNGIFRIRHKDGTWRWVEAVATNMLQEPSVKAIVVNYHDVTERTVAGEALKESEEHFRSLFENMLDGYAHCRMIYDDGRPSDFIYLHVNPVFETLTGLKNVVGKKVSELIPGIREANPELFEVYGNAASTGVPGKLETYVDGLKIWFSISVYSPKPGEFVAVFDNITQRKQAETLQAAVYRIAVAADKTTGLDALYPQIHEIISSVMPAENFYIALYDEEQNKLRFPYSRDLEDDAFPVELTPGKGLTAYVLRTGRSLLCTQALHDELEQQGEVQLVGVPSAIWLGVPLIVGQKTIGALVVQHYSDPHAYGEREQHMLEFVSSQVAIAISRKQAEEQLRYDAALLANVNDAIVASDAQYRVTAWNVAAEAQYGWKADDVLGANGVDLLRTEWADVDAGEMRRSIAEAGHWRGEATQLRKDGTRIPVEVSSIVLRDQAAQITGYISAIRDITDRKAAESRIKRHIDHLTALSEIDRAISSSFDLKFVLLKLLAHVTGQLGADAADILVLDPSTNMLDYAAGLGFRTAALQHTRLHLGERHAGMVALERRTLHLTNLLAHTSDFVRSPEFISEGFDTYFGLPLIVKGKVVGVLEVFKRGPLAADQEWLDFLNTLAGQAAIAIDNAGMFKHLQRSNISLALAYDATLEGWSCALDLRDKDTEGHTRRVAALCVKLAKGFGLSDEELENIRRGGLLHDIGKMGVPDSVLLKPGPLTEDEWVVMKKHPSIAYELISPIEYLRSALEIPYCHHEKWDGTGYPRGLRGEQIPLSARVFAIVDVWDALTSDRPYRKAWPDDRALEYIQSQAGSHFDPLVVKAFMEMMARSSAP